MFELLVIIAFGWLSIKCLGLFFKVAWCAAKVVAAILLAAALPMLIGAALFAGGLMLLIPVVMVGAAFALIRNA